MYGNTKFNKIFNELFTSINVGTGLKMLVIVLFNFVFG